MKQLKKKMRKFDILVLVIVLISILCVSVYAEAPKKVSPLDPPPAAAVLPEKTSGIGSCPRCHHDPVFWSKTTEVCLWEFSYITYNCPHCGIFSEFCD